MFLLTHTDSEVHQVVKRRLNLVLAGNLRDSKYLLGAGRLSSTSGRWLCYMVTDRA